MSLLSQAGLSSSLPVNPSAVLGLVNGVSYGQGGIPNIAGILGQLSSMAASSYATNHVYTPTDSSWASQQTIARGNGIAGAMGSHQAAYADLMAHQSVLPAMRQHVLDASTPKDVQDAQAQIALEEVWTLNQMARQQAITATYQAQNDSIIQRDNEKLTMDIEAFVATSPVN
jgi:hypothetical protein